MTRKYTNKILDLVENIEGDNTLAYKMLRDALNYMSEDEVEDLAAANCYFEDEEDEDEDEDEDFEEDEVPLSIGMRVQARCNLSPFPNGQGYQVCEGTTGTVKHLQEDGDEVVVAWAASFTACHRRDLIPLP